jgi:hypothetical protein
VTQLSDEIEADMLQEVYDDGVQEENDSDDENLGADSDTMDSDESEDFGLVLCIDPDGETSSFATESDESITSLSPLALWENALDESAIILDLPGDSSESLPFPYTSGQPCSQPDLSSGNILGLDLLKIVPSNIHTDTNMLVNSNEEVTTWQEILVAEDHMTELIRTLRLQSTDPCVDQFIAPHVSPTIASRLLDWAPEDPNCHGSRSSSLPPSFSAANAPLFKPTTGFSDFGIQHKQRRHESYGIR